ncbi:MAG: Peptide chain release factor 2 [Acidimicrobiales bacterium]|nr:MAG: peptide chain release factor 2 [Actinomycetota bacterium]MBV6510306.1 Peptide chain release factor 2 [Acidimicrobiales bacterium]RIK03390.1 MAG: peptide chain release factor 2 [Acidobacteriota bacterium]
MQDFSGPLAELAKRLGEAETYLKITELRDRMPQLEAEIGRPGLWDDPDNAKRIQKELSAVSDDLALYDKLRTRLEDANTLYQLAIEEDDDSLAPEIEEAVASLQRELDGLELRAMFTGEYDSGDAVVDVHSGAGGTDSQDWAGILLRMYQRWAERRGFELEMDEVSPGQEAGITTATFIVKGRYAYGLLRGEHGVHRLVRISPFDSNARRHTAFSSVSVTPFVEHAEEEIEIPEKDLRIDTYRSSGAGGQHVNVTDSAVRITHLPTGIVVSCQNERSQHQNKDRAMQILAAKLLELQRARRAEELALIKGDQQSIEWGSQIRSYVLHPYQQVKDHRTGIEIGNVEGVLDGDLDGLMEGYLRWARANPPEGPDHQ